LTQTLIPVWLWVWWWGEDGGMGAEDSPPSPEFSVSSSEASARIT